MTDVILELDQVSAGYQGIPVIRDVSLRVDRGEVVALVGLNGAGKTTTLRAIEGEIPLTTGQVRWKGAAMPRRAHQRARAGLGYVAEDRSVFMSLSVRENLRLGGSGLDAFLALFPEFESMVDTRVGSLSGGEQQMLALGLALGHEPDLLLIDEFSLGLAPKVVERLTHTVNQAAAGGLSVLVVEQQISTALAMASRTYELDRGRVVFEGNALELQERFSSRQTGGFAGGSAAVAGGTAE